MKYAYDFHIHTALSPCADEEMTPNNIINMCLLKQLDVVAVTDHNSAENLSAVCKCGKNNGILVIPGIEVETSEEVHMLCLFPDLKASLLAQEQIYNSLPQMENREEIFGSQLIFDENDSITGKSTRFLMTATKLTIDDVVKMVENLGGVALPAHIDRDSYSILSNLGAIPDSIKTKYIEISKKCNLEELLKKYPNLKEYEVLKSSDAHYLGDIFESQNTLELNKLSVKSILDKLKGISQD